MTEQPVAEPLGVDWKGIDPVAADAVVRETHSAVVVLLGDRAYKIKKPVDLGFLDFRTVAAREAACRRELELNRRLAPDVYLDVASVHDSRGRAVEHMVIMRRMPEALRLAALVTHAPEAAADVSDAECRMHLSRLARLMTRFHATAERRPDVDVEAGAEGLERRWTDNLRETERFRGTSIPAGIHQRIGELAMPYVRGRRALFDRRAAAGCFVDGHGDLTADDVFCFPDGPRVLDCIDFDDRLRYVDVLDDVAFLAMDLERLGRSDLARYWLDRYAEFSAVPRVPSLEHHYIAYRAFVRAKVACIRADQGEAASQDVVDRDLQLALRHLEAGTVTLTLVGGAPGTGKTTIAGRLADIEGAVLLSSDRVRRQLSGGHEPSYDDASRRAVYVALLDQARAALASGESVVADATWSTTAERRLATEVARATHSAFVALECHAPQGLAAARAQRRLLHGGSPSQAGAAVSRALGASREAWPSAIPVDTTGSPDEALRAVAGALMFPTTR